MIPYEELVAALDRYVAKNGGTPMSARAPASSAMPAFAPPPAVSAPAYDAHSTRESAMPPYDEHHDPDMPHEGGEDATHVGASPGGGSGDDRLLGIALDPSGDVTDPSGTPEPVVVTGFTQNASDPTEIDGMVARFSADGKPRPGSRRKATGASFISRKKPASASLPVSRSLLR